jgi:hypothetical protein
LEQGNVNLKSSSCQSVIPGKSILSGEGKRRAYYTYIDEQIATLFNLVTFSEMSATTLDK